MSFSRNIFDQFENVRRGNQGLGVWKCGHRRREGRDTGSFLHKWICLWPPVLLIVKEIYLKAGWLKLNFFVSKAQGWISKKKRNFLATLWTSSAIDSISITTMVQTVSNLNNFPKQLRVLNFQYVCAAFRWVHIICLFVKPYTLCIYYTEYKASLNLALLCPKRAQGCRPGRCPSSWPWSSPLCSWILCLVMIKSHVCQSTHPCLGLSLHLTTVWECER